VPLSADLFERLLAVGAVVLLIPAGAAIMRGRAEWSQVQPAVWAHLLTVLAALVLTPFILLRRRGDGRHRTLGRLWVVAMLAAAITSLFVRDQAGVWRLSPIHALSALVLIQVPLIWWAGRTGRVVLHRHCVRGVVLGALLITGFFTFPFNRLLGRWLIP
jgi:uncharacterized membrane protein